MNHLKLFFVTIGTANYQVNTNLTEMTFFMPSRVMQSTEKYLISFMSMASEIGGYVGLLLGASFFHFAFFLANLFEQRQNRKSNEANMKDVTVKVTPPPKITKITPVFLP